MIFFGKIIYTNKILICGQNLVLGTLKIIFIVIHIDFGLCCFIDGETKGLIRLSSFVHVLSKSHNRRCQMHFLPCVFLKTEGKATTKCRAMFTTGKQACMRKINNSEQNKKHPNSHLANSIVSPTILQKYCTINKPSRI